MIHKNWIIILFGVFSINIGLFIEVSHPLWDGHKAATMLQHSQRPLGVRMRFTDDCG